MLERILPASHALPLARPDLRYVAPGNDISRWKVKEGTESIGYVSDVKRGGTAWKNAILGEVRSTIVHDLEAKG